MVVIAGLVLKKGMYSTKVLAVETPLLVLIVLCWRVTAGRNNKGCSVVSEAFLSSLILLPACGYRVKCEGRERSRGSEVWSETQGASPALPCSYPAWIRCIKNTCGSPQAPLHKQIVPGDLLMRLISLYFHRHANRNNIGLSFISSSSLHFYVKTHQSLSSQWRLCVFWLKTKNCKCSFFFFFFTICTFKT